MRRADVVGEPVAQLRVPDAVRQMGQVGDARAHRPGHLHGGLDVEMGRMRGAEPQRAQHKGVDALQRAHHVGRHFLRVRDVTQPADAESQRLHVPVWQDERKELVADHADGLPVRDRDEAHPRPRPAPRRTGVAEDIAETLAQHRAPVRVRVGGQRTRAAHVQRAQIVDAVGVVRVAMRVPHRVHPRQPGAQKLEAQLGRGVDEHDASVALQRRSVARASVARILRRAAGTIAAHDRNAERRTGAEEGQPQTTSTRSMLVVPGTLKGMPAVTITRSPGPAISWSTRASRATAIMAS